MVAWVQQQVCATGSMVGGGGRADAGQHHPRQPHQMLHAQAHRLSLQPISPRAPSLTTLMRRLMCTHVPVICNCNCHSAALHNSKPSSRHPRLWISTSLPPAPLQPFKFLVKSSGIPGYGSLYVHLQLCKLCTNLAHSSRRLWL